MNKFPIQPIEGKEFVANAVVAVLYEKCRKAGYNIQDIFREFGTEDTMDDLHQFLQLIGWEVVNLQNLPSLTEAEFKEIDAAAWNGLKTEHVSPEAKRLWELTSELDRMKASMGDKWYDAALEHFKLVVSERERGNFNCMALLKPYGA